MKTSTLMRGIGLTALILATTQVRAQETLPTIDVGTAAPSSAADAGGQGDWPNTGPQKDGGPGERFTGYVPNYDKPAASEKSNVPLIQLPQSIQTVTRETMDDRQSLTLKDSVLGTVSGVNLGYANFDRFIIRGFDTFDPIYRDGLQTPWEVSRETANIQSIEVVKGLSSMLYGRNEPGGIVNFVTKKPLFDQTYYSIEEQTNSWGLARTVVDMTAPVDSGKTLAYRFVGVYDRTNSFKDFVTSRSGFISPMVSWRPNEQFRLNVRGEFRDVVYVDQGDQGIPAIGTSVANIPVTRYLENTAIVVGHPENQKKASAGYDWTYDFNKDWSLTNRFGYTFSTMLRNSDAVYAVDDATGWAQRGIYYHVRTLDELNTNMDLKGNFDTGPLNHKTLLGMDYLDNEITDAGCSFWMGNCDGGTGIASMPINIYAPYYLPIRIPFQPTAFNDFWKLRQSQIGVYGQDFISFLDDRVHILLGGRYDWARYGSVTSATSFADIDSKFFSTPDKAFSPNVGVVLQPYPWLSFYGNY
jgi:iron complex outermembrane recepter protein